MRISDEHFYHGAALTQIAEHPKFTAINGFHVNKKLSRSAFKVNDSIGIFLKYASEPQNDYNEYAFNFHKDHLRELKKLNKDTYRTFIGFICVQVKEICCIDYELFLDIIEERCDKVGYKEDQYMILIAAQPNKRFRVYANMPGARGVSLTQHIISRSDFPGVIFEK